MRAALKARSSCCCPRRARLQAAAWPPDTTLDATDMAAARWASKRREPAGRGTGTLPNIAFQFRPLLTPRGAIGVCGFRRKADARPSTPARSANSPLFSTRPRSPSTAPLLTRESAKTAALEQSEKLRSALLSSLSHDLRTPLASIVGAVTSLRQLGDQMSAPSRDDLLVSIQEEAARLSRFVANLLDMTRLEGGALNAKRDWSTSAT